MVGHAPPVGEGRHLVGEQGVCGRGVVKRREGRVLDARELGDVRADGDSLALEPLEGDAARHAQRGGETAREVAAAGDVLRPVPLGPGREVGVSRARDGEDVVVVLRAGVGVLDDRRERCAAGLAARVEAGDDPGGVGLLARGPPGVSAGRAAGDEGGERVEVDGHAGGEPLDHAADGGGVGLPEDGDAQRGS